VSLKNKNTELTHENAGMKTLLPGFLIEEHEHANSKNIEWRYLFAGVAQHVVMLHI